MPPGWGRSVGRYYLGSKYLFYLHQLRHSTTHVGRPGKGLGAVLQIAGAIAIRHSLGQLVSKHHGSRMSLNLQVGSRRCICRETCFSL